MIGVKTIEDGIVYASIFTGSLSLLLSVVIGAIATYFVFRVAKKMGGGLFGSVLNYIGVGMLLIVVGTVFVALDSRLSDLWLILTHTVFFSTGFIFLAIGANKLLKGIITN